MIRLFAGLAIPEPHATQIDFLHGGIPGARWTTKENLHITLTFIGSVDEATAEDIDLALEGIHTDAFDLTVRGTGSFAQGDDPNVLWLGVDRCDALFHLKEKIDAALKKNGLPYEPRKYTPHITLARFRHPDEGKIAEFMQAHNLFTLPAFRVSEFILYESSSTKAGPAYTPLKTYPLVR